MEYPSTNIIVVETGKLEGPGARTSQIGMSSIGMPIAQLLQQENTSAREVKNFQRKCIIFIH